MGTLIWVLWWPIEVTPNGLSESPPTPTGEADKHYACITQTWGLQQLSLTGSIIQENIIITNRSCLYKVCLGLSAESASHSTIFFFQNKSVNNTLCHSLSLHSVIRLLAVSPLDPTEIWVRKIQLVLATKICRLWLGKSESITLRWPHFSFFLRYGKSKSGRKLFDLSSVCRLAPNL